MPTRDVLRWIAIVCGGLLLLAPLGGRTTWEATRGRSFATDAGGYNAIAVVSGMMVLVALLVATGESRPRWLALPGALVVFGAFVLTVYATGVFVAARWRGEVWVYACWCAQPLPADAIVTPAPGPPVFLVVALIGAIAALGLTVRWAREPVLQNTCTASCG